VREKARGPGKEKETEKVWVLATGPAKAREQAMAREPVQEKAPVPERGTGQAQETVPARVQATEPVQEMVTERALATVRAPVQARARCSWVTEPVSRCRRRMRRASA
jgi:hypothetical protein